MKTRTRKRTKRKLLTLLLSLSMLLCYVPQVAVAETVTEISTAKAFRSAVTDSNCSIKLTKDITLTGNLTSKKSVTLDLNGHTITFASEDNGSVLYITNGVNWTIKDSSEDKTGKITGALENDGLIWLGYDEQSNISTTATSLTLKSGTLERRIVISTGSTFTITGGTADSIQNYNGKILANGGTVEGSNQKTIIESPGTLEHTDGCGQTTFLGQLYIGSITIKDGIFKGDVSGSSKTSGAIAGGSFYGNVSPPYGDGTLTISGGTFYNSLDSIPSSGQTVNKITVPADSKIVTYMDDYNGNVYAKQVVKIGEEPAQIDAPTKVGNIFNGWQASGIITQDTTIYAQWFICTHSGYENQRTCTESATCSACGATLNALGHSWESTYTTEGDYHWYKCTREGCNEVQSKATHTYNQEKVGEGYLKTAATCTSPAVYYKSCVCGVCDKSVAATFTSGDKATTHAGTTGSEWITNASSHWHTYSCCGAKSDESAHADDNNDHICDTCKMKISEHSGTATCQAQAICVTCGVSYGETDPSNHAGTLGTVQLYDDTEHWQEYSCCHARAEIANHEYAKENTDAKYLKTAANCKSPAVYYRSCECGYTDPATAKTFTVGDINADKHVDENNDNKCDLCGKTISSSSGGSSGGGGGGSAGGGGAVAPSTTDNVTNKTETTATGTEKVTNAEVSSKTTTKADGSKTTTTTVDTKTADKIVEKAVENKSETVVIDAASSTSNTGSSSSSASGQAAASGKDTSTGSDSGAAAPVAAEVAIPAATVTQLSEKTEAAVTIKTDVAEVTLDQKAVAAIAAAVETKESGSTSAATGEVKVIVTTTANTKSAVKLDVKIETANGEVKNLKGGSVSVTVKLNTTLAAKKLACVYIDDRGIYHKVKGQKNANNTFTFKTL